MRKEKLTPYNSDNPLGWSESDFRDVICTMCNIKFLTGEPLTPLMNCFYLQESDQWKKERLDKMIKQKNINEIGQCATNCIHYEHANINETCGKDFIQLDKLCKCVILDGGICKNFIGKLQEVE